MISLSPNVAPFKWYLTEGSDPADTHWAASLWSSSVLARIASLKPPVTKYVWVNEIQSQYNVKPSTYQLVVVVVIATTVESPRLQQVREGIRHSIGEVLQNSADVTIVTDASCDDNLVTAGHLDTTSISGMRY